MAERCATNLSIQAQYRYGVLIEHFFIQLLKVANKGPALRANQSSKHGKIWIVFLNEIDARNFFYFVIPTLGQNGLIYVRAAT